MNATTLSKPSKRWRKTWKALRMAIWPTVWVFLAVLLVRSLGGTEWASLKLYNLYNETIAQKGPGEEIVIVAFTENDFKLTPNYPYNDEFLTQILQRVVAAQPRTILLNIIREQAVEPGHQELLKLYRSTPNLFGIVGWENGGPFHESAPPILRERDYGFLVGPEDVDFIARLHVLGHVDATKQTQYTALVLLRHYLGAEPRAQIPTLAADGTLRIGAKSYRPLAPFAWEYRQSWPDNVQLHLLPQRHHRVARVVSFGDLLSGKVDASVLRDRLVIVGTSASSVVKYKRTPLLQTNVDGFTAVEFTAMQIDSLLGAARGDVPVLQALPKWLEILFFALLALVSSTLFMRFNTLWAWGLSALAGIVLLVGGGWVLYGAGWLLPVVPLGLTVLFALVVIVQRVLRAASFQRQLVDVMRVLIDKLPDPIFVLDHDRSVRLVNASFCRLAMARPEELIGQSLPTLMTGIETSGEGNHARRGTLLAKDGSERSVQARLTQHESGAGKKLRVGVITATSPAQVPAHVDVMQQLAKRLEVNSYLAEALNQQASFALIVIADFDVVFAAQGPALTQAIEAAVNARLNQTFGESGVISALGNGRFVALTIDPKSDQLAAQLQAKVTSAFSWPVQALGENYELELQFAYGEICPSNLAIEALIAKAQPELQDLLLDYRIAHQMPAISEQPIK